MKDRRRYLPFLEAIENHVAASGKELVVGGRAATRLLLKQPSEPLTLDSYSPIELLSVQAYQHARQLADILYAVDPSGLGHYTRLDAFGADCSIFVDGREMAKVKSMPAHRGSSLADMVIPTNRPAMFVSAQLACMGPEIQLVDTYRALCDPSRAADWPDLLRVEERLRLLFLGDIRGKLRGVTGGRREGPPQKGAAADFWAALAGKFIRGQGRVLVGHGAANPSGLAHGHIRVQVVSANRLGEEAEDLRRMAASHHVTIATTINEPKVPIDLRLQRLTAHIVEKEGKRTPFMDIFGAAQYELIPWVDKGGVRVGTPLVIMRFRLVDLWTMQLLLHIKAIPASYARSILFETVADYESAGSALDRALKGPAAQAAQLLFPFLSDAGAGHGFLGRWEDSTIAQKRRDWSNTGKGAYRPVYFPAAGTRNPGAPS